MSVKISNDQHDQIKRFVRSILGCTCSDEVFRQIELVRSANTFSIAIGGRLLVHLQTVNADTLSAQQLAALQRDGVKQRDEQGYNRFRLVLPAKDVRALSTRLGPGFNDCPQHDARSHLHIISREQADELAWLAGSSS